MKISFVKKILVLSFVLFLFFNIFDSPVKAIDFTPQIAIGNFKGKMPINGNSIGLYITEIYTYLIGVVGILATVVMMIGGVIWITSGGNASRVGEAKAWIGGALMGLVLALASFTILNTVNPDLVSMKNLDITTIDAIGCCLKNGKASYLSEEKCTGGSFSKDKKPNYDKTDCIDKNDYSGPEALGSGVSTSYGEIVPTGND